MQPPHEIIARLITLRVHIDGVAESNAPLQVLAGSHRLGRLTEDAVARLAEDHQTISCLAEAGDVWAYSTPIVHRSAEQRTRGRRRVLQLDYSSDLLPHGFEWQQLL